MAALFADLPEAVARQPCASPSGCEFDLTRDLGYRFPDFVERHRGQTDRDAGRALPPRCSARATRSAAAAGARPRARLRGGAGADRPPRASPASSCCTATSWSWRARWRSRCARPARRGAGCRPGRGRGSSVGSIVCYLTGLSHIDPVDERLFLGRFLNRDMVSVPDIDLDFPRDIRERLIEEVHPPLRRRARGAGRRPSPPSASAWRDPRARQGARPAAEADLERLARLSDGWSVGAAWARSCGACPTGSAKLASTALAGAGLPGPRRRPACPATSPSTRAAWSSARGRWWSWCRVVPAAFPGRQLCQWDKDSCADAGFVKIDLLGLGMLSAVEECVDLIARAARRGGRPLAHRALDDPAVYAEIQDADTVGVFQIESRAQMQSLLQTRPREPRRPHDPGRAHPPRAGQRRRGAPLRRTGAALPRRPRLRAPLRPPAPRRAACARRSAWSSSRSRCWRWRWRWPASPPARPRRCGGR